MPGNDDGGKSSGATVEETFPRVVVDHQFADDLGHAVGRLRRPLRGIGNLTRHHLSAERSDAAGKNDTGCSFPFPEGFQQVATTVQVGVKSVVKALLAFSADHGCKVKYGDVIAINHGENGVAVAHVSRDLVKTQSC